MSCKNLPMQSAVTVSFWILTSHFKFLSMVSCINYLSFPTEANLNNSMHEYVGDTVVNGCGFF